ncbi:hypothetical protein [Pseudarthrobacter sp. MEB009]|uniref:hypothetical protein n=1 Tax=Pseudarthrobacter sp. MEB009 TaxID=3040326 RepID=UPI00255550FB|nr:hypothetical protein [Pseudarthrobacter sp. MEB009]
MKFPLRRRAAAAAAAITLGAMALPVAQLAAGTEARAAGRVSISSPLGGNQAAAGSPTTVSLTGNGFQSIQGGFGGVYVFFGWVSDGAWQPSAGGKTGTDLLYVPDSEARDNQGYQRFIAFPGSGTAASANGGTLGTDGAWSVQLTIPGASFSALDRSGASKTVDCLAVTCGIITIGAHGVANPENESFTPISFTGQATGEANTAPGRAAPGGTAQAGAAQGTGSSVVPGAAAAPGAVPAGPASLGVDSKTIIAGRVLTFNARGFLPGEQVSASVSAGLVGAGALVAGQHGEVAGAVQLPADMRAGTHVIKVAAAASGTTAQAEFSVVADAALLNAQTSTADAGTGWSWPLSAVLAAGGILLLLVLTSLVTAILRRRATKPRRENTPAATA